MLFMSKNLQHNVVLDLEYRSFFFQKKRIFFSKKTYFFFK